MQDPQTANSTVSPGTANVLGEREVLYDTDASAAYDPDMGPGSSYEPDSPREVDWTPRNFRSSGSFTTPMTPMSGGSFGNFSLGTPTNGTLSAASTPGAFSAAMHTPNNSFANSTNHNYSFHSPVLDRMPQREVMRERLARAIIEKDTAISALVRERESLVSALLAVNIGGPEMPPDFSNSSVGSAMNGVVGNLYNAQSSVFQAPDLNLSFTASSPSSFSPLLDLAQQGGKSRKKRKCQRLVLGSPQLTGCGTIPTLEEEDESSDSQSSGSDSQSDSNSEDGDYYAHRRSSYMTSNSHSASVSVAEDSDCESSGSDDSGEQKRKYPVRRMSVIKAGACEKPGLALPGHDTEIDLEAEEEEAEIECEQADIMIENSDSDNSSSSGHSSSDSDSEPEEAKREITPRAGSVFQKPGLALPGFEETLQQNSVALLEEEEEGAEIETMDIVVDGSGSDSDSASSSSDSD